MPPALEYCLCKKYCSICGKQLKLPRNLRYYDEFGYPDLCEYHNRHMFLTTEIREKNRQHMIRYNFTHPGKGQDNNMSKTNIGKRKIKTACERLEKKRLEIIDKSKQEVKIEQKEEIQVINPVNPQKKNILCPIKGFVVKVCFKTRCREYNFCHSTKHSHISNVII